MSEIDKALSDIEYIRLQLAANERFQGFTPPIIALTGVLALTLAALQTMRGDVFWQIVPYFTQWILLAVICTFLVVTDVIIRARIAHRDMADIMIITAFRQFVPAALMGVVFGLFVLFNAPESAWLLPGVWQMLVALGGYSALPNLPKRMFWAVIFYALMGLLSLILADPTSFSPWLMGVAFGVGQLLGAWVLYDARKQAQNDE